eukprot:366217-Chlamydomonas_euryale.AAC.18
MAKPPSSAALVLRHASSVQHSLGASSWRCLSCTSQDEPDRLRGCTKIACDLLCTRVGLSLWQRPPASTLILRVCLCGGCREADRGVEIAGVDVPKGTLVWMPVIGMHPLDEMWGDALAFRPERRLAEGGVGSGAAAAYTPFGRGPRDCIGQVWSAIGRWPGGCPILSLSSHTAQCTFCGYKCKEGEGMRGALPPGSNAGPFAWTLGPGVCVTSCREARAWSPDTQDCCAVASSSCAQDMAITSTKVYVIEMLLRFWFNVDPCMGSKDEVRSREEMAITLGVRGGIHLVAKEHVQK